MRSKAERKRIAKNEKENKKPFSRRTVLSRVCEGSREATRSLWWKVFMEIWVLRLE